MKMLNSYRNAEPSVEIATRLLIMPQDTGICFLVVNASRMRPKKKFAVLRNHFEPWESGNISSVQESELSKKIEQGCRFIIGDDHDITSILFNKITGFRTMEFEEICICLPSAWSSMGRCGLKDYPKPARRRRRICSEHLLRLINTRSLAELREDADRSACVDATAAYMIDQGDWQRDAPLRQRFHNFSYRTEFVFGSLDKVRAIRHSLRQVWESPRTTWTSDFSPLSHLLPESGAVLVDIDKHSSRIHWNVGGNATAVDLHSFGSLSFLHQLSGRLGLLSFSAEEFDAANRARFSVLANEGKPSGFKNLEFKPTAHSSTFAVEQAMLELSATFWKELLCEAEKGLVPADGSCPRVMVVTGDSPMAIHSLCRAASAANWSAGIKWPETRSPEQRQAEPSARATQRAIELFHRKPFAEVPLGSLPLHQTGQICKHVAAMTGAALYLPLYTIAKALATKAAPSSWRAGLRTQTPRRGI